MAHTPIYIIYIRIYYVKEYPRCGQNSNTNYILHTHYIHNTRVPFLFCFDQSYFKYELRILIELCIGIFLLFYRLNCSIPVIFLFHHYTI